MHIHYRKFGNMKNIKINNNFIISIIIMISKVQWNFILCLVLATEN